MNNSRTISTMVLIGAFLTGCNDGGASPGIVRTSAATAGQMEMHTSAGPSSDLLYVANAYSNDPSTVTVYSGRKRNLLRTITDGLQGPSSLALDPTGLLYVANDNNVTVYANQGRNLVRTITRNLKRPNQLALDSAGNLYVLRELGVDIYVHGKSQIMHKINVHGYSLALDASNNLYVGTLSNTVNVYPPGSKTPSQTISDGISFPVSLDFDASGNLYVANNYGGSQNCGSITGGSVTVYAPGGNSPLYTISPSQGICNPFRLAFDSVGNLYVANGVTTGQTSSVTVYAPGSNTLLRSITQGVNGPWALAFDRSDNLYVANATGGNVTEYAPGATSVLQTISNSVDHPESLAIGR